MKMWKWTLLLWLSAIAFGRGEEQPLDPEAAATQVALRWIKLVDSEQYKESFEELSPLIQKGLTLDEWIKSLSTARNALGKVTQRKVEKAFYTTELPDAPAGEYVVVHFETYFEKREDRITEILIPTLIKGEWRIAGYYFK